MTSVAKHKQGILTKRKFQSDPYGALSEYLGDRGGTLPSPEEAIHKAMLEVATEFLDRLVLDPSFIEEVASRIVENVPKPEDGKEGPQGKKGDKGDKGDRGEKGEKPVAGVDYPLPKDGEDGRDGTDADLGGGEIVSRINSLPVEGKEAEGKKIDASHIKGLPKIIDSKFKESVPLFRGGLKLVWNSQLEGTINGVNTIFTLPAGLPDPKDGRYIVSARGALKDADSGDFTVSNSNRTVTFTTAPPTGSARPRIILYHGK